MAEKTLYLRGDQFGTYATRSGTGNGQDRVVTLEGVRAFGSPESLYEVRVEQVNAEASEFYNGPFVTIYDADGAIVMPRTQAQPDIEQGRGDGDEHLIFEQSPFVIDLGGVPVGPQKVIYNSEDEFADPHQGDNDGHLDFEDFPCFVPGTLIETPLGPRDVAELSAGDLVLTEDRRPVALAWTGRRQVSLEGRPRREKPVLIRAHAFGTAVPAQDTVVSPDHRLLISHSACAYLFGVHEVLAPAKGLLKLPGIRTKGGRTSVEYVSLLTLRHEVIQAQGLKVETLYPGPQALRRLGAQYRSEILKLYPGLATQKATEVYPPARRLLTVKETEILVSVLKLRQELPPTEESLQEQSLPRAVG